MGTHPTGSCPSDRRVSELQITASGQALPITKMNQSAVIDSENSLEGITRKGEAAAMKNKVTGPVHLRRIDPSQNMRRYYSLAVQPTLFGGASLIRDWGRIGTKGQTMMETFDQPDEATQAFERLARVKCRRGYCSADAMESD